MKLEQLAKIQKKLEELEAKGGGYITISLNEDGEWFIEMNYKFEILDN